MTALCTQRDDTTTALADATVAKHGVSNAALTSLPSSSNVGGLTMTTV